MENKNKFLSPPFVGVFFYVTLGMFILSVAGLLYEPLMYLWVGGVIAGALSFLILLLVSLIQYIKSEPVTTLGKAFLFLIIFALVGYGTCLVNISSVVLG